MKKSSRGIAIVAAIIVIAGVSWLGLKKYRTRAEQRKQAIDCEHRNAEFAKRVDGIKQDAHKQLKIGTKNAEVSAFFAEHGIPVSFTWSEAIGTLHTSGGCVPLGCGSNSALIGVSVKLDGTGSVAAEPTVVAIYDNCV